MQDVSDIIENEDKLLTDIYSKLEPDIKKLFESNYGDLMHIVQSLRRNITEKLEHVSIFTKYTVDTIYRNRLEEYDYLRKSLSEIGENINRISNNKKQMFESYKEIGMV